MKRIVSISLGSSQRDKEVTVEFGGKQIHIARRGTDGDTERARRLFRELDGHVDALGLGGFELSLRIDDRRYPFRAGMNLVQDVRKTPVVDGSGLKQTLERRVFEFVELLTGTRPRYRRALVLVGADRFGMSRAVCEVADEVVFADLYFALGVPIQLSSLPTLQRMTKLLLPWVRLLPISMLYPTGESQQQNRPRYPSLWEDKDLIAGDFHYIRRSMPLDLTGKTVLTNTTTEADVELLEERGVEWLITTTPRYSGRTFGTNVLEAALTAVAGMGRALTDEELNACIDRFALRPEVRRLNSRRKDFSEAAPKKTGLTARA